MNNNYVDVNTFTVTNTDFTEPKVIKKAVICKKCGANSWRYTHGLVLTSNPPKYEDHYECSECGFPHSVKVEGEEFPAPIELYE